MHKYKKKIINNSRRIGYYEFGRKEGSAVIFFHGSLSSGFSAISAHKAAKELGIRLFAIDRPGIGESSYKRTENVFNLVDDVVKILDVNGVDKFSIIGHSSGWHGKKDNIIPYKSVISLSKLIPESKLLLLKDKGHLFLFAEWRNILKDFN